MNYAIITENLIVGSQPQKPEDVDHLRKEEGVAYILNLQQDMDVEYWGIDLQSIIRRSHELEIRHMRNPVTRPVFSKFIGRKNYCPALCDNNLDNITKLPCIMLLENRDFDCHG